MGDESWDQSRLLMFDALKRIEHRQEEMMHELNTARTEIATLKVKAGLWGAIAGAIPALIAVIISLFRKP